MQRFVHGLAILLALATNAHAQQAGAQEERQAKIDKDETGIIGVLAAQNCFTSGSGVTFLKVCITENGNISFLESPAGKVHINSREGYAVCSVDLGIFTVFGFDMNIAAEGWGPAIVSDNKRIITRTTLDGMFQLKQTFTVLPAAPGVDVKMELKNLSQTTFHDVMIARYFDGDIDGQPVNEYSHTNGAVWGLYLHGLMLNPAPVANVNFSSMMAKFADWDPLGSGPKTGRGCFTNLAPFNSSGDYVGGIRAGWGEIKPGQTKTVTFHYRRF